VTAQRLTGALQAFAGLFDARILLGQSSRDEYVLAGGDGTWFDPRLPAGSGRWMGRRGNGAVIQLARGLQPLPQAELVELPVVRPLADHPIAVVHPRPGQLARRWAQDGVRVVLLGDGPVPADDELRHAAAGPLVLLGDPDAWQAEWSLLGAVRREMPLVVAGCTPTELRSLSRVRDGIPLLGSRPGECWLVDGGTVRRAILEATE
jgi:S-DNA-T family DNA segregation ATPase FtsK/SpoIIIE